MSQIKRDFSCVDQKAGPIREVRKAPVVVRRHAWCTLSSGCLVLSRAGCLSLGVLIWLGRLRSQSHVDRGMERANN